MYKFFYSGPFSQWYTSPFELNGYRFKNAEQYMMYMKACTFGDLISASQLLHTTDPKQAKSLGRQVRNFDLIIWNTVSEPVVFAANIAKFSQNYELGKLLLGTKEILVEASPYDRIWGIGYSEKEALNNKDHWGENKLGIILMEVRENLRKNIKNFKQR